MFLIYPFRKRFNVLQDVQDARLHRYIGVISEKKDTIS